MHEHQIAVITFRLHDLVFEFCEEFTLEHPVVDIGELLACKVQDVVCNPHVFFGLTLKGVQEFVG